MRRLFFLFSLIALLGFAACSAQAQDKIEVFGGYSYLRASTSWDETLRCPGPPCPVTIVNSKLNLNGWEVSGRYKMKPWLGLGADFSSHYGSFNGIKYHELTYLFGPQISLPGKVSPFAHVLVGGAHSTSGTVVSPNSLVAAAGGSPNNAFAAAVGAGIDIKIAPLVSFRPVQIDYLATRFNSSTQSQPRISAGVVLHF
jgi:opacity protein-like surface antigen